MKKLSVIITSFFILYIMLASICTISVNTVETQYVYNSETKTLTINFFNENKPWEDVEYPENIILRSGIEKIPDFAFSFSEDGNSGERRNYYDRIKTVKIPSTVKTIGDYAFDNCKKLEKINIPESVTSIGDCAFRWTKIKKIIIPGTVSLINYKLFCNCNSLEDVELQNGIKAIEFGAFSECNNLKELNLPKTLITIGQGAFNDCKMLSKFKLHDNLKTVEQFAFIGCTALKKVTISKNVSKIDTMAFGYKEQGVKIKNFKIKGYVGSVAEKYAKDNKFTFLDMNGKERQALKVVSKTNIIKLKKLRNKTQKIKPIVVKNAIGKVTYTLLKNSTSKTIRKYLSINKKGVLTFKRWEKLKKGIFKIKIKVTATGKKNIKNV